MREQAKEQGILKFLTGHARALLLAGAAVFMITAGGQSMQVKATETEAAATETQVTEKKGLTEENGTLYFYEKGKKLKSAWKKVSKNKYYFNKKGKAVKGVNKIKGKYYFFDENCKLLKNKKAVVKTVGKDKYIVLKAGKVYTGGWYNLKKKLYYATGKGKLAKNKTISGIKLNKEGEAKYDTIAKALMTASSIVNKA